MKRDCFAYIETTDYMGAKRIPYTSAKCACLKEMECTMHNCSFYRNRKEWEEENMRLYGTADVEEQIRRYISGKGAGAV